MVLQTIMRKWQRFSNLSGFERAIVIKAAAGLAATKVGLRIAGFRRWKDMFSRLEPPTRRGEFTFSLYETAKMISRLESAAARNLFFRPNCLENSLVLWWLLRNRGITAQLRVGARKTGQRLEAHAWVECDGVVLNEPEETHLHFKPFGGPITSIERR